MIFADKIIYVKTRGEIVPVSVDSVRCICLNSYGGGIFAPIEYWFSIFVQMPEKLYGLVRENGEIIQDEDDGPGSQEEVLEFFKWCKNNDPEFKELWRKRTVETGDFENDIPLVLIRPCAKLGDLSSAAHLICAESSIP